MARPRKTVKLDQIIKFRVTYVEKTAIELAAKETSLSTSSFVRKAALNMKVVIRFSQEELDIYHNLQQYHRNFKLIGNLIRGNDFNKKGKIITELDQVISLIKEHLKRFEV